MYVLIKEKTVGSVITRDAALPAAVVKEGGEGAAVSAPGGAVAVSDGTRSGTSSPSSIGDQHQKALQEHKKKIDRYLYSEDKADTATNTGDKNTRVNQRI